VEPYDGAEVHPSQLHEIAELVGDPQSPPALDVVARSGAVGEWIRDQAFIANLADDAVVLEPYAVRPVPTAMADAVWLLPRAQQARGRLPNQG
jgi:hypothetical protein